MDTVSDSCLNVRAEPALAAPILACLPEGTGVAARGERAEADGYEWEAVRAGGALEGWAAAGFLARPGDPSGAPDIGAPPERGLTVIAWPGGPLEGLAGAVAARGGCALRAAWGNGPDGGLVRYRFGASDAVNRAFLDARGGAPPAGTPLLLACADEASAQPPPGPPPPRAALRYGPLDATGEAATPGSWAILGADGEAIPSLARLRDAAALRLHRTDADGEDRGALFGGAAAGDLVEVRAADDCWVRFRATDAPAQPPPPQPYRDIPVGRAAYAPAGCADADRAGADAAVAWDAPPDLRTADIASPVRHGPWLLVPTDWDGLPAARSGGALRLAGEAVEPQSPDIGAAPYAPAETADPDEARRLIPLWRDPALPEGWTLAGAEIGTRNAPPLGYRARYADAQGRTALQIEARPLVRRPDYRWIARGGGGAAVTEARTIDGRPALVRYSPRGPAHDPDLSVFVQVFDAETGIEYALRGYHASLRGGGTGAAIAIARSLYLPPPAATDAPKRYNRLDATGEAAVAGSWAILGADGGVLTDWEALRSEAATLRLHQADASGVSRAAAYGAVESGDIIEWRKAADCWVRYRVTGAPTRPASGSSRWEFPVEWMTYAATGAGCTGAVGATDTLTVDEDAPSVIPASGITSPVRHGPYLVYPNGWTGALETQARRSPPAPAAGGGVTRGITWDITEARRFRYWRDPVLPAGWTFAMAETGTPDAPPDGYTAVYLNAEGYGGVEINVRFLTYRPQRAKASYLGGAAANEPRTVDGRAALVLYSPQGPAHDRLSGVWAWIFDAETGIEYGVRGYDHTLRGSNADAAIAIARSLLPTDGAPAPKRYNRLDPTGEAATTAGSWAILGADGGVIATWEALRSDAATLRLHQADASGVSRAAAYGAVEAGDIIEWRKADDCWVRYRVTGAPTRPASGSSRWEFPVEWMTYAATGAGCTGAVGATDTLTVNEDAPSVVRTSEIASPVRHGADLLIPSGWTGTVEEETRHQAPGSGGGSGAQGASAPRSTPARTTNLAEARRFPYWREPVLPAGWTFSVAEKGTGTTPVLGYCAEYDNARGFYGVKICSGFAAYRPSHLTGRSDGSFVYEGRIIDGHTASVGYSPQGPAHSRYPNVEVLIFDADTGNFYYVRGYDPSLRGSNVDPVIAIARSLLPTDGAPATKCYNRLDPTGEAAAPGSWAILGADGGVLADWEALRSDAAALRLHQADASGASRAAAYGAVEAGDLIEWRKADDCWVRYRVTGAPTRPASGSSRWEFPVEWVTYAGTGCTGAVGTSTSASATLNPPNVTTREITTPVRHGPFLLYGPSADVSNVARERISPANSDAQGAAGGPSWPSSDLSEIRKHPLWKEPTLPSGWIIRNAYAYAYPEIEAWYTNSDGGVLGVIISRQEWGPIDGETWEVSAHLDELRVIDGRPAMLFHNPNGYNRHLHIGIFDPGTGVIYGLEASRAGDLRNNLNGALAILRSLYE